jgi:hypothetical protein
MNARNRYAPEATLIVPLAGTVRGADAIRRYQAGLDAAFPGAITMVLRKVVQGAMVAVEWQYAGLHAGPIALPGGVMAATGRLLTLRGASFLRYARDGLIQDERRYYDVWDALAQLGLG